MKKSRIQHGSRHRPSWQRTKYRKERDAGGDPVSIARDLNAELEWDQWTYGYDEIHDPDTRAGEGYFGFLRDETPKILGGLLTGEELERLIEPELWDKLQSMQLPQAGASDAEIEEWEPLPSDELIEALLERCQEMRSAQRWADLVTVPERDLRALRSVWRVSQERLAVYNQPEDYCLPYHLALVALLEPFWIRPACTWEQPIADDLVGFNSLLKHLFVRYPVPGCLFQSVDWTTTRHTWKWLLWIVLFGSGASLVRAGRRMGWWMNTAFLDQLLQTPPGLSPIQACVWAEVERHGGPGALKVALFDNEAFCIDPTAVEIPEAEKAEPMRKLADIPVWERERDEYFERRRAYRIAFRKFWQATVEWLCRNQRGFPEERYDEVLMWAHQLFDESQHEDERARYAAEAAGEPPPQSRLFTWKGRTIASVMRATEEYFEVLRQQQGPRLQWPSRMWDWQWTGDDGVRWTMRELTRSDMLLKEGNAMHHCVANYASWCADGKCAIFSLRRNGLRAITIEVSLPEIRVNQAHGLCNREATVAEMEVIERWMKETVFKGCPPNMES